MYNAYSLYQSLLSSSYQSILLYNKTFLIFKLNFYKIEKIIINYLNFTYNLNLIFIKLKINIDYSSKKWKPRIIVLHQ